MTSVAASSFLRSLPLLLRAASPSAHDKHGGRPTEAPKRRISVLTSLSRRGVGRLLQRLDVDERGMSRRTGEPAWPASWNLAVDACRHVGAEAHMVLVLASWLERFAPTTRRTYWYEVRGLLKDLRLTTVRDLTSLPHEAGLTWMRQRAIAQGRSGALRPRTVNVSVAVLNSLCRHVSALGIMRSGWHPLRPLPVTRGRHIDEEGVVLDHEQLATWWAEASHLPRHAFLAMMLASLHGLRACEVARLRVRSFHHRRRGQRKAPAVINVIGKGSKHRAVQVHPAMVGHLERLCTGRDPDAPLVADERGDGISEHQVSYWAKRVFRRCGLAGYAHALRATWATAALENRANSPVHVQASGGWKHSNTMNDRYFKRRQVPLIRLLGERA